MAALDSRTDVVLLFTDVVMPEVNGKKLADGQCAAARASKVLYTTGYTPNAVVHGGVLDPGVELRPSPSRWSNWQPRSGLFSAGARLNKKPKREVVVGSQPFSARALRPPFSS